MTSETRIQISQSSVKSFRRCKRQYYYKYVEGLEKRLTKQNLKLGIWFHELMQWHNLGRDWEVRHQQLLKEFNKMFLEEREYYGDLPGKAKGLTESYLYHYREDLADQKIILVEETFVVEHPNGHTFSFKPDLIYEEKSTGMLICKDYKTGKNIPDSEWRISDIQSGIYPWGLRIAGYEVDAFEFDYVRTKAPTVPSINKDGTISRRRIDTDYYTLASFLRDYYADSWPDIPQNWKVQLRTLRQSNAYFKKIRVNKSGDIETRLLQELDYTTQEMLSWHEMAEEIDEDIWPRTMLITCDWDCDFHELCVAELIGGNASFMRKHKYQPSKYLEGRDLGRQ